jgi:hypothetical protein
MASGSVRIRTRPTKAGGVRHKIEARTSTHSVNDFCLTSSDLSEPIVKTFANEARSPWRPNETTQDETDAPGFSSG